MGFSRYWKGDAGPADANAAGRRGCYPRFVGGVARGLPLACPVRRRELHDRSDRALAGGAHPALDCGVGHRSGLRPDHRGLARRRYGHVRIDRAAALGDDDSSRAGAVQEQAITCRSGGCT